MVHKLLIPRPVLEEHDFNQCLCGGSHGLLSQIVCGHFAGEECEEFEVIFANGIAE